MAFENHTIVYIHGISRHSAGFSNSWYASLRPHLPEEFQRSEVVWSDIVNAPIRAAVSVMMEDQTEMRQMQSAIEEVMLDRMIQTDPEETDDTTALASSGTMSMPQARALVADRLDDFLFYMFNSAIREQILARFERVMEPLLTGGRTVQLIAHSWGTVVAYEGLRRLESNLFPGRVANFFCVGSALSIAPVQSNLFGRINSGRKPASTDHWTNIDAKWDVVGGRIGSAFNVDDEQLGLRPTGCSAFLGIINPTCAHSSYFHPDNKKVNEKIFARSILS